MRAEMTRSTACDAAESLAVRWDMDRRTDRRTIVGEISDKIKGHANEAIGKAKRAVGEALDRPDIKAEGNAQEAKGDLQKAKGAVKGAVKDIVDKS